MREIEWFFGGGRGREKTKATEPRGSVASKNERIFLEKRIFFSRGKRSTLLQKEGSQP
jgi:hypothetical protein